MTKHHILLAEDDFDFGSILKQYLEVHNFEVTWCEDGEAAHNAFAKAYSEKNPYSICVLDVMMPKMDGFTLAEKLIEIHPEIPFVFLTARKMKEDRIQGLKLGADDYIVKPFEADILVLRLNNILKRSQRAILNRQNSHKNVENSCQKIGNYQFDLKNHILTIGDKKQSLTEREALLIQFFYKNKNQMLRRENILTNIWESDDFFSGRSMDVFISRLRKYFKEDPSISIASTRGVGLTFKIMDE
ncbi:response regulator transcription factor [Dokdonia sp. Hel_I_53]|uniref:response regulator transcription factor n=1 Tax=Dokdonia sp. Hel_I_53 TaxID=1566287 RepID=UPI00119A924F|nr:response regulator transcription factor [Dokdonia sp. Hel_I_53]TVZ50998.1 DNA-binding response OmpR family regulator [Dokdonia sp. Hel_I_53]